MLKAQNVGIRFGAKRSPLTISGVDLEIKPGETVGLVGESGSGKSSVAKAFVGLNPLATGSVTLDGKEIASPKKFLRNPAKHGVQLVFQDPRTSLNPKMTVGESLIEAAGLLGTDHGAAASSAGAGGSGALGAVASGDPLGADLSVAASSADGVSRGRRNAKERAKELLDMVDLQPTHMSRYPHELSGGQLQRVSIARALALKPNYLLLDEVTASLDVSVQATVLNLLRRLQNELGFAMLYISHDLSVIKYVSDHVYVMRHGKVVEEAASEKLFADPKTEYTQDLLAAVPRLGGGRWQK